jgi:heptosyltransferase II
MHNGAKDSIGLPLPACGERVGVRGGPPTLRAFAPHPTPLPVAPPRDASVAGTLAYGEREQTESVARPVDTSKKRSELSVDKKAAVEVQPQAAGGAVLIVPYMWIGDFVRCHTVVQLLQERNPGVAIDVLATAMVAPLLDYMPGVRQGIIAELPRKKLAFGAHRALARKLDAQGYAHVLVMPRKWKAALAPWLAGIPLRTGFVGEARFGLINDLRFGERTLPRMVDRCAALALQRNERLPASWPLPYLEVPAVEIADWRRRFQVADSRPAIALAPGAVGPSKRWPAEYFAALAKRLVAEGYSVWVFGGPHEKSLADEIVQADHIHMREFTGPDLRNAILGLAAARAAVSNDSGLLHVAAALGKPSVGIFGPTSPWHWAPLNPLSGIIQAPGELACRPCHKPVCRLGHHRCMRDSAVDRVFAEVKRAVGASNNSTFL